MNRVFSNNTNPNRSNDYFGPELQKYGKKTDVFIAVAFFTDSTFVRDLVDNGCKVQLIIRLGFPTKAQDLKWIFNYKNKVDIRYFTTSKFHPKLYIFGNRIAFVGSSNLTDAGRFSNQEINIAIDSEDPAYFELRDIFQRYWEEAVPLTQEALDKYAVIVSQTEAANSKAEKDIIEKIGLVEGTTVKDHNRKKKPQSRIFVEAFLRRYQLFLRNFNVLREIYQSVGRRYVSDERLPLRIEIDQFLSWVREEKTYGDSYADAPVRGGEELSDFVQHNINEFLKTGYGYVDNIATYSYPLIRDYLSSRDRIESLTEEEIREMAGVIHAFNAQLRFHQGGKETLLKAFIEENRVEAIRKTLVHLLFGKGEYTQRLADCIFDPRYKLRHFGQSCIQETYGWANLDNIPIGNERAFKSMQWLGFGEM